MVYIQDTQVVDSRVRRTRKCPGLWRHRVLSVRESVMAFSFYPFLISWIWSNVLRTPRYLRISWKSNFVKIYCYFADPVVLKTITCCSQDNSLLFASSQDPQMSRPMTSLARERSWPCDAGPHDPFQIFWLLSHAPSQTPSYRRISWKS